MAFCRNCGSPLDEEAKFCSNCGANQSFAPQQPFSYQPVPQYIKPTIPGRGLGITSMVLGIIGLVVAFSLFVTAIDILNSSLYRTMDDIMVMIIYSVLSILSITFGASARNKGYRNGVSTSGLVMGIISAFLFVLSFIMLLSA